jgi:nucleoside-diphosphate-sugar epimerase
MNIGNPAEFTVRELAELVRDAAGADVPITFAPLPEDDPTRRRPDITRAGAVLGWRPEVPLREGVERLVAWYRAGRPAPARLPDR